jgi:E3 ubiquitin-protein ligase DOA10
MFISGLDLATLQTTTDPVEMLEIMKGFAGPYALALLVALVLSVLLHAWVLERPAGEAGFISALLKKSLVALVPYMVAMIIFGVMAVMLVSIGIVLLVLPGLFAAIYMATVGVFVMPVMLTETRNPLEALTRSFKLAHKNLWTNIGWVIVVILILIVAALVLGAIVMLPFTGSFLKSIANPDEAAAMLEMARNPVYIGLSALTGGLVTPVMPILAFLLYFRNRGDEVAVEVTTDDGNTVKVEDLYPPMPPVE